MDLVVIATQELAAFLADSLPDLASNWWDDYVLLRLSDEQRQIIEAKAQPDLWDLDLASLLAVLDSNWHLLQARHNLSREARNYLKEMQTIRNQLCHAGARPAPVEVTFRQWETLKLLLERIGGSAEGIRLVSFRLAGLVKAYQVDMSTVAA